MKNIMYGKHYLVFVRQYFFDPNLDKTLLAEYHIEGFGVKVYFRPRVFGGKKLIGAKYQVGFSVKLGISCDGSTRYLDVIPSTREDINSIGSLNLT